MYRGNLFLLIVRIYTYKLVSEIIKEFVFTLELKPHENIIGEINYIS